MRTVAKDDERVVAAVARFGANVRTWRERKLVSPEELGAGLGLSGRSRGSYVGSLERGERTIPSVGRLFLIADVIGVRVCDLLAGVGEDPTRPRTIQIHSGPEQLLTLADLSGMVGTDRRIHHDRASWRVTFLSVSSGPDGQERDWFAELERAELDSAIEGDDS